MESSTSLHDLRRHQGTQIDFADTSKRSEMRSSRSQAYFDKYPERKGQGPYTPSPKLTPTFPYHHESLAGATTAQEPARSSEEKEVHGLRVYRVSERRTDGERSKEYNNPILSHIPPLTSGASSKDDQRNEVSTSQGLGIAPPAFVPIANSPASSSRSPIVDRPADTVHLGGLQEYGVAAAAAKRSFSGYPAHAYPRRTSQKELSHHSQVSSDSLSSSGWVQEFIHDEGQREERPSVDVNAAPTSTTMFRRQLKAQQSMPNVKTPSKKKSQDCFHSYAKPWSSTLKEADGRKWTARDREEVPSSSSSTPSKVMSIDEIIRLHSPGSILARSRSGDLGSSRGSRQMPSDIRRRVEETHKFGSDVESDGSEGSLDSVEREIRHSMLLGKREKGSGSGRRRVPLANAESAAFTTSPSTPTSVGKKKKSTPSLMNPARRRNVLPSSAAATTDATATPPPPPASLHKSSDSAHSAYHLLTQSTTKRSSPSPFANRLGPSSSSSSVSLLSVASQEKEKENSIQTYLRSKRMTSLMLLSRHPYQGQTVSFADVGAPDGHPVFVFLGLGAVRYLVGLYDEMASILKLRLICIDRWGLGKTDDLSAERRGILEWSNVVAEVADRLRIRKFSVLAHSAGAPYAMATCLVHGHRVAGPVHLLAPWVSPTIESGYKWLKYIPDGIIKTAQAADWKMQAWKLGVNKAPIVALPDEKEEEEEEEEGGDCLNEREKGWSPAYETRSSSSSSTTATSHFVRSFDSDPLAAATSAQSSSSRQVVRPPTLMFEQGGLDHYLADGKWSAGTDTSWTTRDNSLSAATTSPSTTSLACPSTTQDKPRAGKTLHSKKSHSFMRRSPSTSTSIFSEHQHQNKPTPALPGQRSPSTERSVSSPWTTARTANEIDVDSSESGFDLTTALLRASHSESLRGGGTNDLLVILGRSSQKPWGFTYTDVEHNILVWHGDKDERINLSSVLWMEREMKECKVNLVKGATHGLMTNISVVVEALER
ncbi:hypothetical protein CBS101457_005853 [Exobasidium rhododendri]|nr:hypothetical protein CBS101457_005853 [Exobasidium rhododendri]